jgi:hypothetical protein
VQSLVELGDLGENVIGKLDHARSIARHLKLSSPQVCLDFWHKK